MRVLLLSLLFVLFSANYVLAAADTVRIYFDRGSAALSPDASFLIDSLVYNDVIRSGKKVGIIGYADNVGNESKNKRLSEERAKKVAEYLLWLGFLEEEIESVWGVGEVSDKPKNKEGYPEDRRVEIIPGGLLIKPKEKAKPGKPAETVKPEPVKTVKPKIKQKLDLENMKVNETVRLNSINFIGGMDRVLPEALPALEALVDELKEHPNMKIGIEGHVCCVRLAAAYKKRFKHAEDELSVKRAKAVYDYLVENGISEDRLKYTGYGFDRPLADPEDNEEDRVKNRRVEIRILEK